MSRNRIVAIASVFLLLVVWGWRREAAHIQAMNAASTQRQEQDSLLVRIHKSDSRTKIELGSQFLSNYPDHPLEPLVKTQVQIARQAIEMSSREEEIAVSRSENRAKLGGLRTRLEASPELESPELLLGLSEDLAAGLPHPTVASDEERSDWQSLARNWAPRLNLRAMQLAKQQQIGGLSKVFDEVQKLIRDNRFDKAAIEYQKILKTTDKQVYDFPLMAALVLKRDVVWYTDRQKWAELYGKLDAQLKVPELTLSLGPKGVAEFADVARVMKVEHDRKLWGDARAKPSVETMNAYLASAPIGSMKSIAKEHIAWTKAMDLPQTFNIGIRSIEWHKWWSSEVTVTITLGEEQIISHSVKCEGTDSTSNGPEKGLIPEQTLIPNTTASISVHLKLNGRPTLGSKLEGSLSHSGSPATMEGTRIPLKMVRDQLDREVVVVLGVEGLPKLPELKEWSEK